MSHRTKRNYSSMQSMHWAISRLNEALPPARKRPTINNAVFNSIVMQDISERLTVQTIDDKKRVTIDLDKKETFEYYDSQGKIVIDPQGVHCIKQCNTDYHTGRRAPWSTVFYNILTAISQRSSCLKHKVAACVVRNTQIISIGYNGTAAGQPECCDLWDVNHPDFKEQHRKWSAANEIHAEINALNYVSKFSSFDCNLICLYLPCVACAKHISGHSIRTVCYYDYHSKEHVEQSKKILSDAGVNIVRLKKPHI